MSGNRDTVSVPPGRTAAFWLGSGRVITAAVDHAGRVTIRAEGSVLRVLPQSETEILVELEDR